jgi:regulator of sigma E protease
VLGQVQEATAAHAAGLLPGDTVLSIDGLAFHDAMMLRQFIRQSAASGDPAPQEWQIDRPQHGQMTLVVTPTRVATDAGYIGRVGVQIGSLPEQVWVQYGVTEGLIKGVNHALDIVSITLHGIWQMVLGEASAKSLTGPLGVAEFAGQAAEIGVAAYLSYLSIISVSLFVLNMLPLPMLDGGHLMYYLLEAVRGRALSPHTLGVMQRIGLCLIVALMIFTFFNDLERMGWLKLF